jgi:hypothetical protein
MFDLDQFIADCRTAIAQDPSHKFIREVVARAVSDPAAALKGLGEPKHAALQPLYRSHGLTILDVIASSFVFNSKFVQLTHDIARLKCRIR